MFKRLRLRKIHARFLESCRNLKEGRDYWAEIGPVRRWILQTIVPIPLLGLHQDGTMLLEALWWLESNCQQEALREETIQRYHRMVYHGAREFLGQYRKHDLSVIGSSIPRASHEKVPAMMKQLGFKVTEEQRKFDGMISVDKESVLASAVDLYQRIGLIHPFADANGRVARLAMNHLLRRYKLCYVILPPLSEPTGLWEALQKAHRGHPNDLIEISKRCFDPV